MARARTGRLAAGYINRIRIELAPLIAINTANRAVLGMCSKRPRAGLGLGSAMTNVATHHRSRAARPRKPARISSRKLAHTPPQPRKSK
jgi:hypothetical protein